MASRGTGATIRGLSMIILLVGTVAASPSVSLGATSVTLTLRASHHGEIDYTNPVRLSGKATSGGTADAGAQVELQANPFPYGGFTTVGQTTTSSTGTYLGFLLRVSGG